MQVARKKSEIEKVEYEAQFEQIYKPLMKVRATFYKVLVKAEKFEKWLDFIIENSSIFRIMTVELDDSETAFSMYILTDHNFNKRDSRLFTYTFVLLWKRKVSDIIRICLDTISNSDLTKMKQSVGDTGKLTRFEYVCRIENIVFFRYQKIVYIFDTISGKHSSYVGSKQVGLFESSLINEFIIQFYEKFIEKSLVVKEK